MVLCTSNLGSIRWCADTLVSLDVFSGIIMMLTTRHARLKESYLPISTVRTYVRPACSSGIRVQLAQQGTEQDRNCARVSARVDELEGLITGSKHLVRHPFDTRLILTPTWISILSMTPSFQEGNGLYLRTEPTTLELHVVQNLVHKLFKTLLGVLPPFSQSARRYCGVGHTPHTPAYPFGSICFKDERAVVKFAGVFLSSNLGFTCCRVASSPNSNSQNRKISVSLRAREWVCLPTPPPLLSPCYCEMKLREAEERARTAFGAIEAKFTDRMAGVESGETVRIEAIELALREQGHQLKEAIEADHRSNKRRSDEIHADVKSLEGRMRTIIVDAQEEESARVGSLLQQAQEQVHTRTQSVDVEHEFNRTKCFFCV